MNKLNLFLACSLLLASTCVFSKSDSLVVFFETNEYHLSSDQQASLNAFCNEIDLNSDFHLLIKGFADHRGTDRYNDHLAEKRAKSVHDFLLKQDLRQEEVKLLSFGEDLSYLRGNDARILAPDRKVVVYFEQRYFEDVSEVLDGLTDNSLSFELNSEEDYHLALPSGAQLKIANDCLLDAEGNPFSGDYELRVREAMSTTQMVSDKLSTISDGRMLETGGMFKIEAFTQDGEALALDGTKPMDLYIPTLDAEEDMEFFLSDEGDNWIPTQQTALILQPLAPVKTTVVQAPDRFDFPEYVRNYATRPSHPVDPIKPREVEKPSREDFQRRFKWYEIFSRKKIRARWDRMYESAMKTYDRKQKKYLARMDRYEELHKTFGKRMKDYEKALTEWEAQEIENEKAYYRKMGVMKDMADEELLAFAQKMADQRYERQRQEYDEKMSKYNEFMAKRNESLDTEDLSVLDDVAAYAFSMNSFGWANCDRFVAPFARRDDIIVDTGGYGMEEERVIALFQNVNAIMEMSFDIDYGKHRLQNIPRNQRANIMAVKVEDGEVFLALEETRSGNEISLAYRPSSQKEIAAILAQEKEI